MKEIAEIQGSNEVAVKTKVSRGRQKLKLLMEERPQSSVSGLLKTLQTITL
jgi:RNA polymerase sigma-70 factor (ECF subfamily)